MSSVIDPGEYFRCVKGYRPENNQIGRTRHAADKFSRDIRDNPAIICHTTSVSFEHLETPSISASNLSRLLTFCAPPPTASSAVAARLKSMARTGWMSAGTSQRARRDDAVEFVANIRGQEARGLRRRGDHARRGLERRCAGPPRSPAPASSTRVGSAARDASEPGDRATACANTSAAHEGRRGAAARSRSSADAAQREPEADERMRARVGSAEEGG